MMESTTRRHGWKPAALVGVSVFLVLLALDVGVRSSLYNNNKNNNSAVAAVGSSHLRRFLQDFEFVDLGDDEDGGNDQPSPLAEAVKDAIKDGMDSGEIGSNHDAIVNVSYVPIEEIEDDDTTEPPVARNVGDDGLDALWIVIICLGGAFVLLLICLAYFCMRQAEREMDDDIAATAAAKDLEDPNNNGAVTSAGEEDEDDDDEEEESSEEEVAAEDQPHGGSGDPNLGKFQVTNDNNVETYDEEIVDDEESSSHNDPPSNNQGVRFNDQPPGTSYEL